MIVGVSDCHRCDLFFARNPAQEKYILSDESIGLGDTFARMFKKFGFNACFKCRKRQSLLNKIFPYFWKDVWKNEEEREIRRLVLTSKQSIYPIWINFSDKVVVGRTIYDIDKEFSHAIVKYEFENNLSID